MDILILKSYFSSAHFYKKTDWSVDKNLKHFGKCYGDFGHGHNYVFEVSLKTNFAKMDSNEIQALQKRIKQLTDILDHKHLNHEVPYFQDKIPSTEMICLYFKEQLEQNLSYREVQKIRVYENTDLWSELYF